MKKLVRLVLVLGITFGMCACGNAETKTEQKSLEERGLEVIALMVEAANSDEYIGLNTGVEDLQKMIKGAGAGDFDEPTNVYAVTLDIDKVLEMVSEEENVDFLEGLSEELQEEIQSKMLTSVIVRINGLGGTLNLAAASVCTMGKTFVDESVTREVVYIYTFEDTVPVAVTFTVGENGAVNATGTFILYEGFTCGSEEELEEYFEMYQAQVDKID